MYGSDMAKTGQLTQAAGPVYADTPSESIGRVRQSVTVSTLIAQAASLEKGTADRAMSLDAFAGRALDIATRLAGPFSAPGPSKNPMTAEPMAEASSALDALGHTISGAGRPLASMDDSMGRLAAALDAIERAI